MYHTSENKHLKYGMEEEGEMETSFCKNDRRLNTLANSDFFMNQKKEHTDDPRDSKNEIKNLAGSINIPQPGIEDVKIQKMGEEIIPHESAMNEYFVHLMQKTVIEAKLQSTENSQEVISETIFEYQNPQDVEKLEKQNMEIRNFLETVQQELRDRMTEEAEKRYQIMKKKTEIQNVEIQKLKIKIKDISERAHVLSKGVHRIQALRMDIQSLCNIVKRAKDTIFPRWITTLENNSDADSVPSTVPLPAYCHGRGLASLIPYPGCYANSPEFRGSNATRGCRTVNIEEALHEAIWQGCHRAVSLLISQGVQTNKKLEDGYAPLHLAAHLGHLEIVIALLDGGAHVDMTDSRGRTPLHCACAAGHATIAALLLRCGAPIDAVDVHRRTALHLAAQSEREDCAGVLLSSGANKRALDEDGRAALELARSVKARLVFRHVMKCFRCRKME